jgi:hypothetical protein
LKIWVEPASSELSGLGPSTVLTMTLTEINQEYERQPDELLDGDYVFISAIHNVVISSKEFDLW